MSFYRTAIVTAFLFSAFGLIQAQAPAGATGQCKDGTYSTAKSKSGACSGHKGVQIWYAATAVTPAGPAAVTPAKPATTAVAPGPSPVATSKPAPAPMPTQQASGGGPGMVWVNTSTKVYHCNGDRYYGKTKKGAYMSEADAQAKGARPDAGKPCPK